jgi:hypothetical protein
VKWSTIVSVLGVILSLLTIAGVIYNAGRQEEHTTAALRRLCEQIQVLQQIAVSEHPAYSPTIYVRKGCDE